MNSIKNWVPAIFLMSIIFLLSSATGQTIESSGLGKESIQINGHLFLFFFLCIAFYKATKDIAASIILTVFYGVLDEIHQTFVYLRSPSIFDIKIDTVGALLGGLILWKLLPLLPEKLKNWLKE